jgi:predicted ATPase
MRAGGLGFRREERWKSRDSGSLAPRPFVTLRGPGSVGTTRLASEPADRERPRGRVVALADLASARTLRKAMVAIASALGVVLSEG